jgi:hypothetical protein
MAGDKSLEPASKLHGFSLFALFSGFPRLAKANGLTAPYILVEALV